MAIHRYWRVLVVKKETGSNYFGFSKIEFRAVKGGASLMGSGTPYAISEYDANRAATKAVDGLSTTEWLGSESDSGPEIYSWWGYDFGSGNGVDVAEVVIGSRANVVMGPITFELQYSDDNSSWASKILWFNIPAWSGEGSQRVLNADLSFAVAAKNVAPKQMTSNTAPSPFVASASAESSSTYAAYRAFSYGHDKRWASGTATAWLKLDRGAGNTSEISSIGIQAHATSPSASPKDFTVQGSNNDSDWDVLETVTGSTGWVGYEHREFQLTTTGNYRYYKIDITATDGWPTISLVELYLYEAPWYIPVAPTPDGTHLIIENSSAEALTIEGWTPSIGTMRISGYGYDDGQGTQCFEGGADEDETLAYQDLILADNNITSTEIDSDNLILRLEWRQSSQDDLDKARVYAEFLNESDDVITSLLSNEAKCLSTRQDLRYVQGHVPVGTRTVRLYHNFTRYSGITLNSRISKTTATILRDQILLDITNHDADGGSVTGWINESGTLGVLNTEPSFIGSHYFYGVGTTELIATQELDLADNWVSLSDIDSGVTDLLVEYAQNYTSDEDTGQVFCRFLNSSRALISDYEPGLVAATASGWNAMSYTLSIPANTRYIEICINGVLVDGADINSEFDFIYASVLGATFEAPSSSGAGPMVFIIN